MGRFATRFIVGCWLLGASAPGAGSAAPSRVAVKLAPGARPASAQAPAGATPATGARSAAGTTRPSGECVSCHPTSAGILSGPMATRASERAFAQRAFGASGDEFFEASCAGCHVAKCQDCHGAEAHSANPRPADEACLRCHNGYSVGWEFYGRAPREDHARYQRGATAQGRPFLKMLPDVHRERGLGCADCHLLHAGPSAGSGMAGAGTTKGCLDCHPRPSPEVPEHAIRAHLEKLECYACHSAWGAQEYGTFLVRATSDEQLDAFSPLPAWGPWRKSAYLKRQDAPPLGLDERGLVSPIRPQFVLFATDAARGWENRLLAAEWKAYFPHSVRRGSVTCDGCHAAPRRYLLEPDAERLYLLEQDGLPLRSFWSRAGQTVSNGAFLPAERHERMNRKTPEYVKRYLEQWQNLLERDGPSSAR